MYSGIVEVLQNRDFWRHRRCCGSECGMGARMRNTYCQPVLGMPLETGMRSLTGGMARIPVEDLQGARLRLTMSPMSTLGNMTTEDLLLRLRAAACTRTIGGRRGTKSMRTVTARMALRAGIVGVSRIMCNLSMIGLCPCIWCPCALLGFLPCI